MSTKNVPLKTLSTVEVVEFVLNSKQNVFVPVADQAVWQDIFGVLEVKVDFVGQNEFEKLAVSIWKALYHTHFGFIKFLENENVTEDVPVGDWLL